MIGATMHVLIVEFMDEAAALDVFETEPLPAGSPLAGCPHLILTPHIAGVTRESNARVSMMIAEKVAAALEAAGANP